MPKLNSKLPRGYFLSTISTGKLSRKRSGLSDSAVNLPHKSLSGMKNYCSVLNVSCVMKFGGCWYGSTGPYLISNSL